MNNASSEEQNSELRLTATDIRQAADEGVITHQAADQLVQWGYSQRYNLGRTGKKAETPTEQIRGLNLVTVAYYFGAMLMITACGWFLGSKWDALGSVGIFITTLIYMAISAGTGVWLRRREYLVGGGLLITVAVSLVPLLTFTIEDMLGLWPGEHPGSYQNFYPWINGSWIVMELMTIVVAAMVLRHVRFGFLTAPMAFSFWFLSMDIAEIIFGNEYFSYQHRSWVSVVVGLITIGIGFGLERWNNKTDLTRSEDLAFWCYLFGMFAFWGGLTSMNSGSELKKFLYCLINIGLIGLSIKMHRTVFLVFGALGVHIYLGYLAFELFKDSFLFPFALAFLGLTMILGTVYLQKRLKRVAAA